MPMVTHYISLLILPALSGGSYARLFTIGVGILVLAVFGSCPSRKLVKRRCNFGSSRGMVVIP